MIFHYDLTGAEPIVRDMPVYDSALIDLGEILMLGTTDPDSGADCGISFVTGYTGANTELEDAIGVSNEKQTSFTAYTSGGTYGKVIINPFAVYLAEYDQDTTATIVSSSSTSLTITSIEDDIDGGWIYVVSGSPAANTGALRFITADTTNTLTMYSALPSTATGGTAIKILPQNHRLTALNTASTKIKSQAAAGSGTNLCVVENYIESNGNVIEPLRYSKHKELNALSGAKFYADIVLLDHLFTNTKDPNA